MWVLAVDRRNAKLLECSIRSTESLSCSEQTFLPQFVQGTATNLNTIV